MKTYQLSESFIGPPLGTVVKKQFLKTRFSVNKRESWDRNMKTQAISLKDIQYSAQ